jgi:hypothetical protein
LRVRIGRLLDRIGAVAVKNTVYVLPRNDEAQEHYQWIVKEIVQEGGEATVFEAKFVEGLQDSKVERLFRDARDRDYRELLKQARETQSSLARPLSGKKRRARVETDVRRLRRQFGEIASIDFFGAPSRQAAELVISGLEERLRAQEDNRAEKSPVTYRIQDYRGRTWVTRRDIHVDRMASAWLIRRFIDSKAKFRFVPGKSHTPENGEVRFDMFEGEFTHEGDKCSFEVLVDRFGLEDPALRPLAEIVHDIDLKDEKYRRPETRGIESVIRSIAHSHALDPQRIARASEMLDDLYEYLKRARP